MVMMMIAPEKKNSPFVFCKTSGPLAVPTLTEFIMHLPSLAETVMHRLYC